MTKTARRMEGEEAAQTPKKTKTTQQQSQQQQQGDDRISELPDDILHPILSLLTLKEACITSSISKRWRNLFPTLPRLHFDRFSFGYSSVPSYHEINIRCWLESVRDILKSRRAPVRTCTIRSSQFNRYRVDFDNIICFLCSNGIQELTIDHTPRRPLQRYTVPSCLYFCSTAARIELYRCILKVPSKLCRLRRLNVLSIEECIVEDGDMQRLILGCPAVESLTLDRCRRLRNFDVDAPKLAVLDVSAYSPLALSILRAPRLESVTYRFLYDFDHETHPGDEGNDTDTDEGDVRRLVRLVESLGNIQNLELGFQTMREGLAVPVTLRPILPKMKELTLRLLPNDTYELSVLSCLLNCCPNLEDLVVVDDYMNYCRAPDDSLLGYWNQQIPSDCVRNTLSTVTLCGVGLDCHWKFVVQLAKFLLNNACVLKKVIIVLKKVIECFDIQKKKMSRMVEDLQRAMLLLSPASPDAVVLFKAGRRWMVYRPARFTFDLHLNRRLDNELTADRPSSLVDKGCSDTRNGSVFCD